MMAQQAAELLKGSARRLKLIERSADEAACQVLACGDVSKALLAHVDLHLVRFGLRFRKASVAMCLVSVFDSFNLKIKTKAFVVLAALALMPLQQALAYQIPADPGNAWTAAGTTASKVTPSGVRVSVTAGSNMSFFNLTNTALMAGTGTGGAPVGTFLTPALPAATNGLGVLSLFMRNTFRKTNELLDSFNFRVFDKPLGPTV